ncbi:MAG: protein kinase [Planctomycetes bacterium]|nr:protein kinase [Planctomycetota bacterium]
MSEESGVFAAPSSGGDEISSLARAKTVFLSVRELGLVERQEAVDAACGDDAALKELVWTLLRGDEGPLAIESLADDIRAASEGEKSDGSRIGNYRLLERVGEGGFGVVYAAEQERPVRRRVALKIIKLGMDTKQVVARFEAERQALAMMDHPCIARVYDGGVTPTGRPYFVMELVKGVPITHYCDEQDLSVAQRLALVVRVCDALRHAHQKGVIHRDIKPSNVLITTLDGKAEPKIIDFGVAKAVSGKLTDRTLFTEVRQVIGTPEYMSPEQADPTVQDVDTRADVYGVGVLMYELLTGTTPFSSERLRTAAYGEMQRTIREEEPPAPSTRARSASRSGNAVRGSLRSELPSTLRGELDWIVLKAMEKDRTRRYPGVGALASDIERYLAGEAVHAVPPSRGYLLKKFVRRHRKLVFASVLLVASLLLGLVGTAAGLIKSDGLRRLAEAEKEKADVSAREAREAEGLARRRAYTANMMSASAAMESQQSGAAEAALDSVPLDERGWEWRVLDARRDCSVRTISIPIEYTADKENFRLALLMHPDGKSFFATDELATVCARQFDLATGRQLRTFAAPRPTKMHGLTHVMLSGDSMLAVSSPLLNQEPFAPRVTRWRLDGSGEMETRTVPVSGETRALEAVLSPDGSEIFFVNGPMVERVEVSTGRVAARIDAPSFYPVAVGGVERSYLATSELRGGGFGLRDGRTLETVMVAQGHGAIMDVRFSPDGAAVASAADDDTARVWDLTKGQRTKGPKGQIEQEDIEAQDIPYKVLAHPSRVGGIAFSHDSRLVATVCGDSAVRIWDRPTGALREMFASRGLVNKPVMFCAEDTKIAAMQRDGTIRFWELGAESTRVLRGHANIVSAARFVRRGGGEAAAIVSGGWDQNYGSAGLVRLWDAATGREIASYAGKPGDICRGLEVSSDGRRAVMAITETRHSEIPRGRVVMLDLGNGREIWSTALENAGAFCGFGRDEETVLVRWNRPLFMTSAVVGVFDASDGRLIRSRMLENNLWEESAISPDGRTMAIMGREPSESGLMILNAETLDTIAAMRFEGGKAVAFSPDGKSLAAAAVDGTIHILDAATLRRVGRLEGHGMLVLAVAYSPDGTRIASAGLDRKIRLWDAKTLDPVGYLSGHTGHIGSLDWEEFETSAGKKELRLLSCSGDGTVRIWEPRMLRERLEVRERRRAALEKVLPRLEECVRAKGFEGGWEEVLRMEDERERGAGEVWLMGEGWKREGK